MDPGVSNLGVGCPRVRLPSCWDTQSSLVIIQFRERTALSESSPQWEDLQERTPSEAHLERAVLKVERPGALLCPGAWLLDLDSDCRSYDFLCSGRAGLPSGNAEFSPGCLSHLL